jgi:AcrR family transcriptional regulator
MGQSSSVVQRDHSADAARRLIEATIEAIERGGEASVRVTEVAAAAGVSKSSIYYFFGDREGLVSAAEAERYARTVFGFDIGHAYLDSNPTPADWVEFVVFGYSSFGDADGERRRRERIEILGSAVSNERLRAVVADANRRWIDELEELIDRAQGMGMMGTSHSAAAIATWMQTLMTGRYQIEILDDAERLRHWDEVTGTVIRALCA